MKKWNMIIDVAECTNCNLCTLAAMDEYVDNAFPGYSAPMPKHGHQWINILQKERGSLPLLDVAYVPTMCNHCDNAPCVAKSGGAIKKRDDGIVLIDPEKAKGRKDLVEACPYGHIWWNEELQLPQAWTFDAHLIDAGWKQTRGQQSCPTGAMRAVSLDDAEMAKLAREQGLEVMGAELGTKPRVYYKNLWRYSKCFIGGSVSAEAAATSFIEHQPGNVQIGIVAFSSFAEVLQSPTNDTESLLAAVNSLLVGRRTAIGSGILKAIDAIAQSDPGVRPSDPPGSSDSPVAPVVPCASCPPWLCVRAMRLP